MLETDQKKLFTCGDGRLIAANLNHALLKNYRFDAEFTAVEHTESLPVLYAPFADNNGCIAFSTSAITALVNMALGQTDFDNEPTATTSAAIAVINKLSATMAKTFGFSFLNCVSAECPPDFDINSAFAFKISNQYDFWIYIPSCRRSSLAPDLPIELTALIRQASIPLNQLTEWKVGSFLPLGIEKNAEISILHNNKPLFKGIMGQKSRHIAVKITQKVS